MNDNKFLVLVTALIILNISIFTYCIANFSPSQDGIEQIKIVEDYKRGIMPDRITQRSIILTITLYVASCASIPYDAAIMFLYLLSFITIMVMSIAALGERRGAVLGLIIMFFPYMIRPASMYLTTGLEMAFVLGLFASIYLTAKDPRFVAPAHLFLIMLYLSRSNVAAHYVLAGTVGITLLAYYINKKTAFAAPYNCAGLLVFPFIFMRLPRTPALPSMPAEPTAIITQSIVVLFIFLIFLLMLAPRNRDTAPGKTLNALVLILLGIIALTAIYSGQIAVTFGYETKLFALNAAKLRYMALPFVGLAFISAAHFHDRHNGGMVTVERGIEVLLCLAFSLVVCFWLGLVAIASSLTKGRVQATTALLFALVFISPAMLLPAEYVQDHPEIRDCEEYVKTLPGNVTIALITYRGSALTKDFLTAETGREILDYNRANRTEYDYIIVHLPPSNRRHPEYYVGQRDVIASFDSPDWVKTPIRSQLFSLVTISPISSTRSIDIYGGVTYAM